MAAVAAEGVVVGASAVPMIEEHDYYWRKTAGNKRRHAANTSTNTTNCMFPVHNNVSSTHGACENDSNTIGGPALMPVPEVVTSARLSFGVR